MWNSKACHVPWWICHPRAEVLTDLLCFGGEWEVHLAARPAPVDLEPQESYLVPRRGEACGLWAQDRQEIFPAGEVSAVSEIRPLAFPEFASAVSAIGCNLQEWILCKFPNSQRPMNLEFQVLRVWWVELVPKKWAICSASAASVALTWRNFVLTKNFFF